MSEQTKAKDTLRERVSAVIEKIRPYIKADGGDIELVDIAAGGKVSIRFSGACKGCPMSAMTLKMGVERHLKESVPEISEVVSVP